MTAAGVVTITKSVPIYGHNLKGRTFAVREFTTSVFSGGMVVAHVVLPGDPQAYPLPDDYWVRVA